MGWPWKPGPASRPPPHRPLFCSSDPMAGPCLSLWAGQVNQVCWNAAGGGPASMLSALEKGDSSLPFPSSFSAFTCSTWLFLLKVDAAPLPHP